jgi:DNA polymerase-3 subunit beta
LCRDALVERVVKLARLADTIQFRVSETRIECLAKGRSVASKLIDGTYPDWRRVIPREYVATAETDVHSLMVALERLDAIAERKDKTPAAGVAWNGDGEIGLSLPRAADGTADDAIEAKAVDGTAKFGISIAKMLATLKQLGGDTVLLKVSAGNGPIAVLDPGDERYFSLVMPMRVW